jgi:SecD/SecF fusion protein
MRRNFTWPLIFCLVPLAAAAAVAGSAWMNFGDPKAVGLQFNLGVDLAGGTILVYEGAEKLDKPEDFPSDQLAAALRKRIDPSSTREITIRPVPSNPPRVEIVLPMKQGSKQGNLEIEHVRSVVQQVGKLEFRLLADQRDASDREHPGDAAGEAAAFQDARERLQGWVADKNNIPPPPFPEDKRYEWKELSETSVKEAKNYAGAPKGFQPSGNIFMYHAPEVNRHFILTKIPQKDEKVEGEDIAASNPDFSSGHWEVAFVLKSSGGDKMWELTRKAEHYLAIILDDKIQSYPVLKPGVRLRDAGRIEMGRDQDVKKRVDELVLILRSGALPATLKPKPVSELTMGPGLGADMIRRGSMAIVIAFVAVVIFMISYYRFAGTVASVALFANLLLTIGFMVAVKASFTLPGLAGLVLTLGMAVDANVLIYERIREERERGAGLTLAVRNGYDRAFPTIIDTHLTSIFTAIVLYAVGNDQLKGFGVSLTAGLIISLFTSLYMTRVMFDFWISRNWLKKLSMFKLLSKPNIDFMRVRYYWFTATVVLSVLGMIVFIIRGEQGWNIDFTGGTAYAVQFKEPQAIGKVRDAIAKSKLPDPTVDALFRGEDGETADETRHYTFRTTLKDREEVRDIVANTFAGQLVFVEITPGKIEEVSAADKKYRVEFTFANKSVTADEVGRIVEAWYKKEGVSRPSEYYELPKQATQTEDGSRVELTFSLPPDVASPKEALVKQVASELHLPTSERLELFDPQLAGETQNRALAAIVLSWLAITMYLWFRFASWTFGTAAVLCLIHDLTFTIGLIGFSHYIVNYTPIGGFLLLEDFKLDLPAVAALLTLVGYSVNDTIVVFDRIREVRGKSPELTAKMINDSVNQTLSRTLLTSFTVWLVVFILYVAGGEGVHLFSFVMVIGVIVGTYSSIFVASPLLLIFGEGHQPERPGQRRLQTQEATV